MPPKQDPIRSMQDVLVDLQHKKSIIFNNLIKCNFCYFTLLIPPYLGCLGPSPPLHATDDTLTCLHATDDTLTFKHIMHTKLHKLMIICKFNVGNSSKKIQWTLPCTFTYQASPFSVHCQVEISAGRALRESQCTLEGKARYVNVRGSVHWGN